MIFPAAIFTANGYRAEKLIQSAAILLYCTLVRLRSQSRGWMKSDTSAGVLILDNPVAFPRRRISSSSSSISRGRWACSFFTPLRDDFLAWLPASIRTPAHDLATRGFRVAQEWLEYEALQRESTPRDSRAD